jgi:raffinose/stachyose/melibiose transport system permease protein
MDRYKKMGIYILLPLVALGQLFPLIWLTDFSLLKSGDFYSSEILKWPSVPQWHNYFVAWTDGKVPHYLMNSLIVTGSTIVLTVFLSLTLGYAFTRMRWKLSGFFLIIILLGMMIPIHATLLPNFMVFGKLGITDSYIALILPYTAISVPFGTFIMTGFLESIPVALEESAVMDGAGIYRIIFQVILPLTKAASVTIIVTTFLSCWNEFIMAATYLSSEIFKTLPFAVMNFAGQYASDYGAQFAVMTLTSIPALLIFIIFSEQITKGVTVGAVKE